MINFYIEIRYFRKAKHKIKNLINEVNNKFNLKKGHKVPHITLIQPFTTKNQSWLISDFKRICSKQKLMEFSVDGFGVFPFFVVFAKINPNEKLLEFRNDLLKKIKSYCHIKDINRSFKPHTTIALKMGFFKFFRIWFFMKSKQKLNFTNQVMRVTLLKERKILYEYDSISRKLLNRRQALSRNELSKTFRGLKTKRPF